VLLQARGAGSPEIRVVQTKVLELAESLDDTDYSLRAMYHLSLYHFVIGDYRGALAMADRFSKVAERTNDPGDPLTARRLDAYALHALGQQRAALRHLEPLIDNAELIRKRRTHTVRFHFDPLPMVGCYYARILWLQGFPDRALRVADQLVQDARANGHLPSLLCALFY